MLPRQSTDHYVVGDAIFIKQTPSTLIWKAYERQYGRAGLSTQELEPRDITRGEFWKKIIREQDCSAGFQISKVEIHNASIV